jgi:hypothetical protein
VHLGEDDEGRILPVSVRPIKAEKWIRGRSRLRPCASLAGPPPGLPPVVSADHAVSISGTEGSKLNEG